MLTVTSENLNEARVIKAIEKAGYKAETIIINRRLRGRAGFLLGSVTDKTG